MGIFTDRLELVHIDGERWETGRDLEYHVGYKGSDERIRIPQGYITDLASVPWLATLFIPRSGFYNACAVLHDYLYHKQGRVVLYDRNDHTIPRVYSRAECDEIFLEAMNALIDTMPGDTPIQRLNRSIARSKARIMYAAVRTFGQWAWDN